LALTQEILIRFQNADPISHQSDAPQTWGTRVAFRPDREIDSVAKVSTGMSSNGRKTDSESVNEDSISSVPTKLYITLNRGASNFEAQRKIMLCYKDT
jgi:hypothetical protein